MESLSSTYQSYLLRLWREKPGESWRAMLESSSSNVRYSFADMEDLFSFLRNQTEQEEPLDNEMDW